MRNLNIFILSIFLSLAGVQESLANNFEKKWSFELNNFSATNTVQAQPKEYLDRLILVDGVGNLIALDKKTGKLVYKTFLGPGVGRRGFEIDHDKGEIIISQNQKLLVLKIDNGEILSSRNSVPSVVAPVITKQCYIVFGRTGQINCHNKNFDQITWTKNLGGTARIWSNTNYFKKTDLVYFVTSNPGGLIYNEDRIDNYSSSLVAIKASTGEIVFSKRMVKNDVWDFDGVGKPIIVENYLQNDGLEVDLVIGVNKTGTIFAVNAKNGEDIKQDQFETVEFTAELGKNLDRSNSQILPKWPNRVAEIRVDQNDLRIDQLQKFKLRHAKFQEFLRPSVHYDVVTKGLHGGPEWHGGIFYNDRVNNQKLLAYPSNNTTWILRVRYERKPPFPLKIAQKLTSVALKIKFHLDSKVQKIGSYFSKQSDSALSISNRIESRWSQDSWSNSGMESKVRNFYHKFFDYESTGKIYRNNCASCHGFDRNGKYQSELYGDGYVPSLVGYTLTEKYSFAQDYKNLIEIHGDIAFPNEKEVNSIFSGFHELDTKLREQNNLQEKGFWQVLLGKDSLPLNKAPWGSVKIVDLYTGDLKGSLAVGKSRDVLGNDVESSIIFGGLGEPTSQGKTMLTGTVDSSAYYISLADLKIDSTLKLKRPGSVNPYLTTIDSCEAWIFVETGGRFSFYDRKNNGFTVEAFINKDNCF